MSEQSPIPFELKKLIDVANDLELDVELRMHTIPMIGRFSSYEALVALLDIARNQKATYRERDLALKTAREVLKVLASRRD